MYSDDDGSNSSLLVENFDGCKIKTQFCPSRSDMMPGYCSLGRRVGRSRIGFYRRGCMLARGEA